MEIESSDENFRTRRARSFRERPEKTGEGLRRVRSFKTTSKGLVNRGDSFKSRKTTTTSASEYTGCQREIENGGKIDSGTHRNYVIPKVTMTKSEDQTNTFRVLMLGSEGVGKSSIIDQFMTSEFLGSGSFNVCKYHKSLSLPTLSSRIAIQCTLILRCVDKFYHFD